MREVEVGRYLRPVIANYSQFRVYEETDKNRKGKRRKEQNLILKERDSCKTNRYVLVNN